MPVVERTPHRLFLKSGSSTLTLDKATDKATLQRKLLFWGLKPAGAPLSQVTDITIETAIDRASSRRGLSHDADHARHRGLGFSSRVQEGRVGKCVCHPRFPCKHGLATGAVKQNGF